MEEVRFINIKGLRKKYFLTQEEMGSLIGLSERNYREKEKGNIPFTQIDIMKIILIFDLNATEAYNLFYVECVNNIFWKKNRCEIKYNIDKHTKTKNVN